MWVVWTLATLFGSDLGEHLVFKGGTSLSKAYHVIRRFSEDVDLTYDIRAIAPDLVGEGWRGPAEKSERGETVVEGRPIPPARVGQRNGSASSCRCDRRAIAARDPQGRRRQAVRRLRSDLGGIGLCGSERDAGVRCPLDGRAGQPTRCGVRCGRTDRRRRVSNDGARGRDACRADLLGEGDRNARLCLQERLASASPATGTTLFDWTMRASPPSHYCRPQPRQCRCPPQEHVLRGESGRWRGHRL